MCAQTVLSQLEGDIFSRDSAGCQSLAVSLHQFVAHHKPEDHRFNMFTVVLNRQNSHSIVCFSNKTLLSHRALSRSPAALPVSASSSSSRLSCWFICATSRDGV